MKTRIEFETLGEATSHAFYHGGWIASNHHVSAGKITNRWYSPSPDHTPSVLMAEFPGDCEIGGYRYFEGKY